MRLLLAAIVLGTLPSVAAADGWEGRMSAHDRDRLAREAAALGTGLRAALAGGTAGDVAALVDILSDPARPIDPEALVGDWRCRTIKLGGPFGALTVYGFFKCRVSFGPDGLVFEKTTGSQRKLGDLYPDWAGASGADAVTRFVYLGGEYYGNDTPRGYRGEGDPASPDFRDEIGYLTMPHSGRALLGLPWPTRESDYDILDLRR